MSSVFGTVKVCCGGRDGEIPGEAPIAGCAEVTGRLILVAWRHKSANFSC
jgi:hypothetical protein